MVLRPETVSKHEELIRQMSVTVDKYEKIGRRDASMFDWTLRVLENCSLSTVEPQYLGSLAIIKTEFALWEVLLDDLVDNEETRNFKLFDELMKIPFDPDHMDRSKLNANEASYLEITKDIWDNDLMGVIKKYPHYERYKKAFNFDVMQLLNALRYSKFVNDDERTANVIENEAYIPHGMQIMIQMDLDLMCSKGFNDAELGMLRQLTYISQKMARIGNLLGTYPRELLESDMSSEAVLKFIKQREGGITFKLNKLLKRESRYPRFEEKIIKEWQDYYQLITEIAKEIKSIDTGRFLKEREYIEKAYEMKIDTW